jgi:peptidoglycan/LPS O-acetylase OafA/YrhL
MGAGRIGVFDGLRAYALFGVVIMHLFGISGVLAVGRNDALSHAIWTVFGNTIDLFFVISGFLLFLPVLRRGGIKGGAQAFYIRRLARIQPEYWLALAVVILMIALIPVPFEPALPSFGSVVIHFFDLQTIVRMFDPSFTVGFWIDGAVWMIPVLVGLYLVFPPFSRLMLKYPWPALLLALAVTVGWKYGVHHLPGVLSWLAGGDATAEQRVIIATEQSPSFAWSFGAGMFAALLYQRSRENPGTRWETTALPLVFALAAVAWVLTGIHFADAAVTSTTGFDGSGIGRTAILPNVIGTACRATLVLFVTLGPPLLKRVFDNRFAATGARLSYGLYLIHLPIAFYLGQLLDLPANGTIGALLLWSVLVFPLSLSWAWVSSRYVGKPAIAWTEKRLTNEAK